MFVLQTNKGDELSNRIQNTLGNYDEMKDLFKTALPFGSSRRGNNISRHVLHLKLPFWPSTFSWYEHAVSCNMMCAMEINPM